MKSTLRSRSIKLRDDSEQVFTFYSTRHFFAGGSGKNINRIKKFFSSHARRIWTASFLFFLRSRIISCADHLAIFRKVTYVHVWLKRALSASTIRTLSLEKQNERKQSRFFMPYKSLSVCAWKWHFDGEWRSLTSHLEMRWLTDWTTHDDWLEILSHAISVFFELEKWSDVNSKARCVSKAFNSFRLFDRSFRERENVIEAKKGQMSL